MKLNFKLNLQSKLMLGIVFLLAAVSLTIGATALTAAHQQFTTTIEEKAMSDVKMSLEVIDATLPGYWSVQNGILYKGATKITDNNNLVDRLSYLTGNTVTIFVGNTRVATTLVLNGQRAVGTQAADNVAAIVLSEQNTYRGEANVLGTKYHTEYVPLKDINGQIVGMFFEGISKNFADEQENIIISKILFCILTTLLIAFFFAWHLGQRLTKPLQKLTAVAKEIATSQNILYDTCALPLGNDDETGQLIAAFRNMMIQLRARNKILHINEEKYRTLVNNLNVGIFRNNLDPAAGFLEVNPAFLKMFGYMHIDDLAKSKPLNLYQDNAEENFTDTITTLQQNGFIKNREVVLHKKDGALIHCSVSATAAYDSNGNIRWLDGAIEDITERKQAELTLQNANLELTALYEEVTATEEELRGNYNQLRQQEDKLLCSEERYRLAMEGAHDIIWDIDLKTGTVYTSYRMQELLGINVPNEGIAHKDWLQCIMPADREQRDEAFKKHLQKQAPFYYAEFRFKDGNDKIVWVASRGKALFDTTGTPVRLTGSLTDITAQKQASECIEQMAFYDLLTNLPKRSLLERQFTHFTSFNCADSTANDNMHLVSLEQNTLAFVLADLDNFKMVNDMYGHATGDLLLQKIADYFKSIVTKNFFASRFGGDEFIFLLANDDSAPLKNAEITAMLEKLQLNVNKPYRINGHLLQPTISLGVSLYPRDGNTISELLQNADLALYKVKETTKNSFSFYEPALRAKMQHTIEIEAGLRLGLKENHFCLHYQPQICLKTGVLYGFEALVRWNHPQKGLIPPLDFIPIAEQTGLIRPLGQWVLQEACTFIKKLSVRTGQQLQISVNLSPLQLEEAKFTANIQQALQNSGLPAKQLEIEITETILLQSFEESCSKLNKLRQLGIKVSMDDFGTGYSSLTYLQRLPIDILKIDRTFIRNIHTDHNVQALIASIINLSHLYAFSVVVEGLETPEHITLLQEMGCDLGQGYQIARPLPETEVYNWLHNYNASLNENCNSAQASYL